MSLRHKLSVDSHSVDQPRTLLLIWQDPASRKFVRVGSLQHLDGGSYVFQYSSDVESLEGFSPLSEFPELSGVYASESLPAFFANRVMSQERPSYALYRTWLGLEEGTDTPFEVLARTGGGRATDTFHVVDMPSRGASALARFFVSGVRYQEAASRLIEVMKEGDRLCLRPEPDNPVNANAILVDAEQGEPVGWIPDWLLSDLPNDIVDPTRFALFVERVNPDAPDHLKLLVRIDAV